MIVHHMQKVVGCKNDYVVIVVDLIVFIKPKANLINLAFLDFEDHLINNLV